MSNNVIVNDNKRALLAHKEKILEDIKYYAKRIDNFIANRKSLYFEDPDSADSDDDFPNNIGTGPTVIQLKLEQSKLRTCLQATQELTNLVVLQSEINIMVEDPVMEREPLVKEEGIWREVTAECRVDLIPFSITFYIHQPSRLFGHTSYRGLHVISVKSAHEAELAKSVLPGLTRPSDAVEVLRSYAAAYRSRRTTLAELVDRFASALFMEAIAEGGFILKCANLLEVSWRLENKWSPVASFQHRLKIEIEYMDESYIKIITQAHKELSDPSIHTNERTQLLSKIISTCLEAQGPTQELYESMESDPESVKRLEKRRTTLDEQPEAAVIKKNKDSEVMAPPKSLPKKNKPKGKENENDSRKSDSRAVKRVNTDNNEGSSVKISKTSDKFIDNESVNLATKGAVNKNSAKNSVTGQNSNAKNAETATNNTKKVASILTSGKKVENTTKVTNKELHHNKPKEGSQNPIETVRTNAKSADIKKTAKESVTSLNKPESGVANRKIVEKTKKSSKESNKNQLNANRNINVQSTKKDSVANTKKSISSLNKAAEIGKKINKNVAESKTYQVEAGNVGKKMGITVEKKTKVNSVATLNKEKVPEIVEKNKNCTNLNEKDDIEKDIQAENVLNSGNKIKKAVSDGKKRILIKNLSHKNPSAKNKLTQLQSKPMISSGSTGKKVLAGKVENKKQNISKIPQKKISPILQSVVKKNALRISPRKFPSNFKSPLASNNRKNVKKIATNIPRLMKKPTPKTIQT